MIGPLFVVGILVAVFVGYNIGGSTTGPAFGPAVGADVISKAGAAALFSVSFAIGAVTLGPEVIDTLSDGIIDGAGVFTLRTGVAVLFFIGLALFVGNLFGVPASTSMTTVGAIAALAQAAGALDWAVLGEIVVWWIVAPIIGFWVSGVIGRYLYPKLNQMVAIDASDGPVVELDQSGTVPRPVRGPGTTRRELTGVTVVVAIGCLMAFASGTSNVANAVAPLVGSGTLDVGTAVLLGSGAVALGSFTIARRTLDTMGSDITALPLTAAIIVASVSSFLTVGLSAIGIPASFVIIATMSIIGLGWGRATRTTTAVGGVRGEESTTVSVGSLAGDEEGEELPEIGEEEPEDIPAASELFNPSTTARVVIMQNVVPLISTAGAYLTFRFVPIFGL
ncbi:anion permease [Halovenus halobia]|uniref:inorganic phosphate transporter n=1 Tax=Halovenus halobia TaxID=3396622 RepID=UPI003F567563